MHTSIVTLTVALAATTIGFAPGERPTLDPVRVAADAATPAPHPSPDPARGHMEPASEARHQRVDPGPGALGTTDTGPRGGKTGSSATTSGPGSAAGGVP